MTAARCFVLVNMVCWFFGRGSSFLSIGQYHFIFFSFTRFTCFFLCVDNHSHNSFQKRFLLESLVCCVIHYTEILRVLFFLSIVFWGLKVTRFLANVFFTAPLVQFSTICFEVKLDTNWVKDIKGERRIWEVTYENGLCLR